MFSSSETIEIIKKAFSGVKLGDGISLREARAIDDHKSVIKRIEARKKDELMDWDKISYKDIEKYSGIFSFLDAKGILFHLPAYMIYLVRNHGNKNSFDAEEDVIYSLLPNKETQSWFSDRFSLIEIKHKEAITAFLDWKLCNTHDAYDADEIRQALEYWSNA
jgi:hypothetical protein